MSSLSQEIPLQEVLVETEYNLSRTYSAPRCEIKLNPDSTAFPVWMKSFIIPNLYHSQKV